MNQSTSAAVWAEAFWSRVCPLKALQKDVSRCEVLINQTLQIPSDHTGEEKLNTESHSNQTVQRSSCPHQIIKKPHLHVFWEAVEFCYDVCYIHSVISNRPLTCLSLNSFQLHCACELSLQLTHLTSFLCAPPVHASPRDSLAARCVVLRCCCPGCSTGSSTCLWLSPAILQTTCSYGSCRHCRLSRLPHNIVSWHTQEANFSLRLTEGRSRLSTMWPRKAVVILTGSEMFVKTEACTQARASHRISLRVVAACTRRRLHQLNDARVTHLAYCSYYSCYYSQ